MNSYKFNYTCWQSKMAYIDVRKPKISEKGLTKGKRTDVSILWLPLSVYNWPVDGATDIWHPVIGDCCKKDSGNLLTDRVGCCSGKKHLFGKWLFLRKTSIFYTT